MKNKGKEKFKAPTKGRGKECFWCKNKSEPKWEDYAKLAEYLSTRGRILSANTSGVCMKHQRKMASAIKQARHLALLPFTTSLE
jgi:small subunit ribosomal protein S18